VKNYLISILLLVTLCILAFTVTNQVIGSPFQEKSNVEWKEASVKDFDSSEELKRRSIYADWESITIANSKPLLFYFYWPVEDKNSKEKDAKTNATVSEKFDKLLATDSVRKELAAYECIKIDMRMLKQWGSKGEVVAAKYKVQKTPRLVLYDRTAFPQDVLDEKIKEETLAEKLNFIAGIGVNSGIEWVTAEAMAFDDEKTLKKRSVFEDWSKTRELGEAKPMVFFFYWPEEDAKSKDADKDEKSQAEKTKHLKKAFNNSSVTKQLERFYCFKIDVKELKSFGKPGESYLSKYKIRKAPVLVIYDFKGNRLMSISGKQESKVLARKLKMGADKSDRLLKK
jgi:thioredoxin-related protein